MQPRTFFRNALAGLCRAGILCLLCLAIGCQGPRHNKKTNAQMNPCLVIVLDGLRPDYVTPVLMPNLHALGQRGVVGQNHHSVFPTVTRVNAASMATGVYPAAHGLLGNSVYYPKISPRRGLDTGDAKNLQRIEEATGGKLLTAPSLGERLQKAGKKLLVVSSGSTGSAFLLNHKISGGAVINCEMVLPAALQPRVDEILGPPPSDGYPNDGRNGWAVDALLKVGLPEVRPDVTILWLSDPDHTQHKAGVGAPLTLDSIRLVDAQVGRLLSGLVERGLKGRINIFVTSDHGFSTHTGSKDLKSLLIQKWLKDSDDSDDVVIVQGAIYVKDRDVERTRRIVAELQKTDWVGAIFTKARGAGETEGVIPGTLSMDLAHWTHARAADILVSADWNERMNRYGYRGTSTQTGTAGHGTSSPFDIHNTLVASGPDIKLGETLSTPTGNIDFAPTICHLLGIETDSRMDGRVLMELLRGGPSAGSIKVAHRIFQTEARWTNGSYQLELSQSKIGNTTYLNFTRVRRGP